LLCPTRVFDFFEAPPSATYQKKGNTPFHSHSISPWPSKNFGLPVVDDSVYIMAYNHLFIGKSRTQSFWYSRASASLTASIGLNVYINTRTSSLSLKQRLTRSQSPSLPVRLSGYRLLQVMPTINQLVVLLMVQGAMSVGEMPESPSSCEYVGSGGQTKYNYRMWQLTSSFKPI